MKINEILEKEPDSRSDQECKELVPLLRDFPFIKKYADKFNEKEMCELANGLQLRKYVKDKRIFCTGDKAEDLFVIMRGQVAILYPNSQIHEL